MSVSNPVLAWVATIMSGVSVAQSSSLTGTVHITAGWEIQVPFRVQFASQVSADPIINIFPASDGGTVYDTQPMFSFAIARNANGAQQQSIRLPTGQYAIQLLNSGPNTATFFIQTAQVVSAISVV